MLRLCPHHVLEKLLIGFYNGLIYTTRMTIYTVVDKADMNKYIDETYALINDMPHNHY